MADLQSYQPAKTPTVSERSSDRTSGCILPEKNVTKVSIKEFTPMQLWMKTLSKHKSMYFIFIYLLYWIAALCHDCSDCIFLTIVAVGCIGYLLYSCILHSYPDTTDVAVSYFQNIRAFFQTDLATKVTRIAAVVFVLGTLAAVAISKPARLVSLLGYFVFIAAAYAFSYKRKQIQWSPVLRGLFLQFILAIFVLQTYAGFAIFKFIGAQIGVLVGYGRAGMEMVYGPQLLELHPFAFEVLPVIIFIAAIISVVYYLGIFSTIIMSIGRVLASALECSVLESISAACNLILSMSDVPMLLKPFLAKMTNAELHAMMTVGMASTSGSTLGAYISIGIPAKDLVACTVMSIPCGLAISKIVYPETSKAATEEIELEKSTEGNVIEAAARGAQIGVQIVIIIAGMLVAAVAIIAMLNSWLSYFGSHIGINGLSFNSLCSYLFYPIAFLLGVPMEECLTAASLIGTKVTVNEFIAFQDLVKLYETQKVSKRVFEICSYAICGFANFGSIGVQLGSLAPLVPERTSDLAKLVVSAMICGNLATLLTASLAALLM